MTSSNSYLLLRDFSAIWSLFHVLFLFISLYEPRYSKRKTMLLTGIFMGSLLLVVSSLILIKGTIWVINVCIPLITLPSLLFFWILSSQRDGRFVFTFCLVDTLSLWWLAVTMLLNLWLTPNTYWMIFWGRMIGFPLMVYLVYYKFRAPYLAVQHAIARGWLAFACVSAVFYLLLLVVALFPTNIYQRPEGIPAMVLLLILMPLMYWNIFQVLLRQQRLVTAEEETHYLQLQSKMMTQRITQSMEQEKAISIYRHDLRHRLQTISTMLEDGNTEQALAYIASSNQNLTDTHRKKWCVHPMLDAVFSSYFQQAEAASITVEASLDIPADLPIDATELSTVFSNALENAIHATKQLPIEDRKIRCRCICQPQLMFDISNTYTGKISFDAHHRPIAIDPHHGLGTRSIASYCEKHHATCTYKVNNQWFTIQIVQPLSGD